MIRNEDVRLRFIDVSPNERDLMSFNKSRRSFCENFISYPKPIGNECRVPSWCKVISHPYPNNVGLLYSSFVVCGLFPFSRKWIRGRIYILLGS